MIDIVIPLGNGSPWGNNELRYCLRSIVKHLACFRNIYIVGEKPPWIQNIIHIPFKEVSLAAVREKNICHKVKEACMQEGLSNDFLFFNDDHFLLQDVQADAFSFYHMGNMSDRIKASHVDNPYLKTVKNTIRLLGDQLNYDCHCPVLFNQSLYLDINNRINWELPYGYLMKSIYCNEAKVQGQYLPDLKINQPLSEPEICSLIEGRPFFSIGNAGLNDVMKYVLQELYPTPSKYEIQ